MDVVDLSLVLHEPLIQEVLKYTHCKLTVWYNQTDLAGTTAGNPWDRHAIICANRR